MRRILNYWPEEEDRPEGTGPLRYVAIRIRKRQEELFADGSEAKYFAVASNEWEWGPKKLLEWQREKAGSIEAVHDVLKNELGVMPCARFGADAAWLRLALITHNVLNALKRIGLPETWLRARPKRLRFQIFCSPGKLIHHARRLLLRVCRLRSQLEQWTEVWRLLPVGAWPLTDGYSTSLFRNVAAVSAVESPQLGTAPPPHTSVALFNKPRNVRPLSNRPFP